MLSLNQVLVLTVVVFVAFMIYKAKNKDKTLFSSIAGNRPGISLSQNRLIETSNRMDTGLRTDSYSVGNPAVNRMNTFGGRY